MADYTILVRTPTGQLIAQLNRFQRLEYVLKEGDVGALSLTLGEEIPFEWLARDTRLEVLRSVDGGEPAIEGETVWFVRRPEDALTEGAHTRTLTAYDAKDLLRRRVVAYKAGTAQSRKNQPCDDMCKAIVRENLGALATDPLRNLSAWLAVEADRGYTTTVPKSFNYGRVLTVLQELCDLSAQHAVYLTFDIVRTSDTMLEFRTYTDQRGMDHTFPASAAPVLLSPESGTLGDVSIVYDYASEISVVYAGGAGEGSARYVVTQDEPARTTLTPFNRIEQFIDARGSLNTEVLSESLSALWAGRPRATFTARAVDTAAVRYGLHYRHGDVVTAQWGNQSFNCRVDPVHVTVSEDGEAIDVTLQGDALI
jgi:hypothetical protein